MLQSQRHMHRKCPWVNWQGTEQIRFQLPLQYAINHVSYRFQSIT